MSKLKATSGDYNHRKDSDGILSVTYEQALH